MGPNTAHLLPAGSIEAPMEPRHDRRLKRPPKPPTPERLHARALHYLERFAMPAAAAFIQGLGQAAAMSNTVSSVSPYGTVTSQISPMSVSQQAWVGAGAAAQAVGKELTQTTPKGPTIYLEANIGVGVMFLSDVTEK